MDAGLAAVLGATVGAVGTGGAAVVAALLARSQARFQLTAEHRRSLRDPRRSAYVAYASGFREAYDLFMEARHKTEDAVESTDNREELREQALGKFREATAAHSALKHHEAVIHVEGPREVTAAVIQAGGKLQKFRSAILDVLGQAYDEDTSTTVDSLDAKAADAHDGYVDFLHAASDALNADLLALED